MKRIWMILVMFALAALTACGAKGSAPSAENAADVSMQAPSEEVFVPRSNSGQEAAEGTEENIADLANRATVLKGVALRTGREGMSEEIASWLTEIGMAD